MEDVIAPGAGNIWVGISIAARSVVGPWIAVETVQVIGIDLWIGLVIVPAGLRMHPQWVQGHTMPATLGMNVYIYGCSPELVQRSAAAPSERSLPSP